MKYIISKQRCLILFFLFSSLWRSNAQSKTNFGAEITKSEIRITDNGYSLFLNGKAFYIKGAGASDMSRLETLKNHGANAFRTWSTHNGRALLDKAHELGLKVMMGLWVGLERQGFDYNDEKAVAQQLKRIRKRVLELKDHPALMIWGIGNELNHYSENPKVWNAVNEISKMIHDEDPYHLTTTPLAGINTKYVDLIAERAPDLDFLSVQLYAPIDRLPELIANSNYKGPLLITEWGATGYWEVETTQWGAPIENNSSVKADLYRKRYETSILDQSEQVMGSFVFLWGQKQERTPTWFGMFLSDGSETESVDAMHYAWNGKWPENRTPRLHDFTLNGQKAGDNIKLKVGSNYFAQVEATDPDNDGLSFRWEIMRESASQKTGGDREKIPESIDDLFVDDTASEVAFSAPSQPGAYRLFIYVADGHLHTAHANIPFLVEN